MTKEQKKRYDRKYREQGYRRKVNRRYYLTHRKELLQRAKMKYAERRKAQESAPG